jgi:hypothetical protein
MTRLVPVFCTFLAISTAGCSNGRPGDVAKQPGDCYCELSNPEVMAVNGELRFKVHYLFPDGPPRVDAWFTCTFEIMGTSTSSVTLRRQGRELMDEGDFDVSTNPSFLRSLHGAFAVTVKQGTTKAGPFHEVSSRLLAEF